MREASEPTRVRRPDLATPLELVRERRDAAPDHVAFRVPDAEGALVDLTLTDFFHRLDRIGAALARAGVRQGDHVVIMGSTSFGWALAEWGIWRAGGVVVPIYETSAPETIADIITTVAARVAFVDAQAASRMPSIDGLTIVPLPPGDELGTTFGVDPSSDELAELDARRPTRDDTATIVFTSGTSGDPQATVLAHRNFVDLALNVQVVWSDVLREGGSTVVFLPLAHVLARGLQTICLWAGMRLSYVGEPAQLVGQLPTLQPTFLVVVPRVLEKLVEAARNTATSAHIGWFWSDAERVAIAWGRACEDADRAPTARGRLQVSASLRARHQLYSRVFYRALIARMGGRLTHMLSGAAPLDPELSLMFRGMGIPVMEGYGLTETTAPLSGNRPGHIRSGTVGQPLPGTSIRIDDQSRVWVRGVGVSPGYRDPAQTAAAHHDGWFDTGDLGTLDADGYLTITGRAKEVIVTAGGKTVSPATWQRAVASDPLVAHAVMLGDRRPYLSSLLLLDADAFAQWHPGREVATRRLDAATSLVTDADLLARMGRLVSSANGLVSQSESVKRFLVLLTDLSAESGLVTPTQKLRRAHVLDRFHDLVADLYRDGDDTSLGVSSVTEPSANR